MGLWRLAVYCGVFVPSVHDVFLDYQPFFEERRPNMPWEYDFELAEYVVDAAGKLGW